MNIVFWFLIIILLCLIWIQLSFVFKHIGNAAIDLYDDVKEDISSAKENDTEEKGVKN